MKKLAIEKTVAVIVGVNHEVEAAFAVRKAAPKKKEGSPKIQPSIEEVEKWDTEVYERVVARYLTEEDLVTQDERGVRFFVEKVTIILAGRQVPSIVHKQYICAVVSQMAVLRAKVEQEANEAAARKAAAIEARKKYVAEQERKAAEVAKKKTTAPIAVSDSTVVSVEKNVPVFTEEERKLRDKLFTAEKLDMVPRGYALKLDGLISKLNEALVLNGGARFVYGGIVYLIDDKTGRKIIKRFSGAKFKEEVKETSSNVSAVATKAPADNPSEKFELAQVTGKLGTILVKVIPFGSVKSKGELAEIAKSIPIGMLFAIKCGEDYQVKKRTENGCLPMGSYFKATDREVQGQKKALKAKTPKTPVKTVDLLATPMQLALQGAMQKKQVFTREAAMA